MDQDAGNKRRRADSIEGTGRGGNNEQRGRREPEPRQDCRFQESMKSRGGWRGGRGGGSDAVRGGRGSGSGMGRMPAY
jgi:hypothetical protein